MTPSRCRVSAGHREPYSYSSYYPHALLRRQGEQDSAAPAGVLILFERVIDLDDNMIDRVRHLHPIIIIITSRPVRCALQLLLLPIPSTYS